MVKYLQQKLALPFKFSKLDDSKKVTKKNLSLLISYNQPLKTSFMNLKHFFPFLVLLFSLNLLCCTKDNPAPGKGKSSAIFNPNKEYGTVTDIDGNEYKTITIGTQTWMAENLRVTHYQNGDPIPNVKNNIEWSRLSTGAYSSYNNTKNLDSIATFGYLYNWFTCVDERNLCPYEWHVPSDEEWTTLVTYLDNGESAFDPYGDNGIVGGRIKEAGSSHWGISNQSDNSSGLTALPAGFRIGYNGDFDGYCNRTFFWSTTKYYENGSFHRSLSSPFKSIIRQALSNEEGMSVRCIKD